MWNDNNINEEIIINEIIMCINNINDSNDNNVILMIM